jgi:hypothetical protein
LLIENCHDHAAKVVFALTGRSPEIGTIDARRYDLPLVAIQAN